MIRPKWTLQPSCRLCGFEIESDVRVLCSYPALEAVRDPSFAAEVDLAMFLWSSLVQFKAAAQLILTFGFKDKTAELCHDRGR